MEVLRNKKKVYSYIKVLKNQDIISSWLTFVFCLTLIKKKYFLAVVNSFFFFFNSKIVVSGI